MQKTCDFCQIETNNLGFDDAHGAMDGAMYGFFCDLCYKINDLHWQITGIRLKAELEITMNRRAFNRMRKEIKNV